MARPGGSGPALHPFRGDPPSVLQHTPQSAGNTQRDSGRALCPGARARAGSRDRDTSQWTAVAPGAGPFQATSLQPVKDTPPPLGPEGVRTQDSTGLPSPGRSTWTLSPPGLWVSSTVRPLLLSLELLPGQPGDWGLHLAWWLLGHGGPWKVTWLLPVLPSRKYEREGSSPA